MSHYYVETDGEVYLIARQGRLTFPTSLEELPFPVEEKRVMCVLGQEVHFCVPRLKRHPRWYHKDELIGREDVDPLVRRAVNTSLPRVVVEAVIVQDEEVLLVKASRGYNRGRWTLPGGFLSYGESLEEAVAREVYEELGVAAEVGPLLGVESFIGRDKGLHWQMFFYEAHLKGQELSPPPDEILEARWFPIQEALRHVRFPTLRRQLQRLCRQRQRQHQPQRSQR